MAQDGRTRHVYFATTVHLHLYDPQGSSQSQQIITVSGGQSVPSSSAEAQSTDSSHAIFSEHEWLKLNHAGVVEKGHEYMANESRADTSGTSIDYHEQGSSVVRGAWERQDEGERDFLSAWMMWQKGGGGQNTNLIRRELPRLDLYTSRWRDLIGGSPSWYLPLSSDFSAGQSSMGPGDFYPTLTHMVALEDLEVLSTNQTPPSHTVKGHVLVKNAGYEKVVFARWTSDDWRTQTDTLAKHVEHLPCVRDTGADRFRFKLHVTANQLMGSTNAELSCPGPNTLNTIVQLAVCYQVNGETYWANNDGANFTIVLSHA